MASRHMTIRSALVMYYRKFVRHNRKLPGRIGIDDVASNVYDKKLGRANANSSNIMKQVNMESAMEQQLAELKNMVAALAAAQGGGGGGKSSSSGRRDDRGAPSPAPPLRRADSGRSLSRGRDRAGRSELRAESRAASRPTKEGPGRSSQLRSRTNSKRSSGMKLHDLEA